MADDLNELRKDLDDEYAKVRENLKGIHDALDHLEKAGPEADLSTLLDDLEDTVKKVRTGGLIGGGAKGHHKARERYLEAKEGK